MSPTTHSTPLFGRHSELHYHGRQAGRQTDPQAGRQAGSQTDETADQSGTTEFDHSPVHSHSRSRSRAFRHSGIQAFGQAGRHAYDDLSAQHHHDQHQLTEFTHSTMSRPLGVVWCLLCCSWLSRLGLGLPLCFGLSLGLWLGLGLGFGGSGFALGFGLALGGSLLDRRLLRLGLQRIT